MKGVTSFIQQTVLFLQQHAAYGALFLRIAFGIHLIYVAHDSVFSYSKLLEFSKFLEDKSVPYPLFNAFLSTGIQFISGVLMIIGAAIRVLSAMLIVHFTVAILVAHIGDPYERYYPAVQMIALSLFFVFNGAGKFSVDNLFSSRRKKRRQKTGNSEQSSVNSH